MYIILIILLIGIIFLTIENLRAQTHVDNKAYDVMLSTLLKHSVPEIAVDSFKQSTTCVLLDAREKAEYNVSHIQNAIWVGYNDFDMNRIATINKSDRIVVYCSVGYRSEKIAEKLKAAGYTNTSNLYGGIFEWVNDGNTIINSMNEPTQKIHAYSKTWGVWLNKGEKIYDE